MGYSNLLAEDKRLVTYRPRLNEVTGSVTATVLLQQIIFHADNVGNRPFYKFRAPCGHRLYKEGDSWIEELGFSPAEFDTARSKIATRVKKGDSKTEVLRGETANHLVIYWTDANRVTWYMLNVGLLNRVLEGLYTNSRNSNYQSEESPNSENQDSGNTRKLGKEELPLSEITTETPKEDTKKTQAIPSEKADPPIPDDAAIVDAIIEQTMTHPGPCDLGLITEEAQAEAGNWADPGKDGLPRFGLFCLYDKRNKAPPTQGTNQHRQQCERVGEALRSYGYQQASMELVEKAAEIYCERKGAWVNVFYKSFVADFGVALQDAEYFLKYGHLPDDQKGGTSHGSHQRDIAQGAVQRQVATEEEARAILGDDYFT